MEDLLGLGKGSEKLIEVIASAVGAIYRPYGMRKEAEAEAYKIKLIEKAKSEQKAEEIREVAQAKKDEMLILDSATSTLEDRVTARKRFNEIRQQNNLESVIRGAFNHIKDDISQEPVDPDWLQVLVKYAEEANSEQMQDLWSRVLAGETELPGSFSLRALETLKKMSKKDAELFQAACQIASSFNINGDTMIIYSFKCPTIRDTVKETVETLLDKEFPEPKVIDLRNYWLGLKNRRTLDDLGLIYSDAITSSKFRSDGVKMLVAGYSIILKPKSDKSEYSSYQFSQIGVELSKLIDAPPHTGYFDEFSKAAEKAFVIIHEKADEKEFNQAPN